MGSMFLNKESINPRILCNVLAPIFICGFLGNIICIIVFLRRRFRSRSISVYFIALFFNDCLLLFISHVAKMLIFDASSSCWFNIYLSSFIDRIGYREMIYRQGLSVLTYNTTYTQISMLIFMFMSIQRVRTFSSISYREGRMCALILTLIAFIYGIIISYVQLYDGFCIKQLKLTNQQSKQIDMLMNDAEYIANSMCSANTMTTTSIITRFMNEIAPNITTSYNSLQVYNRPQRALITSFNNNNSMCYSEADWRRIRHHSTAYVYLQPYMLIDWPDEHANPSNCSTENVVPDYLLSAIDNLTWPLLQTRSGHDYFLEHQFCTQTYHFIDLYANCSFPISAERFHRWYKFLYDRRLSLKNRYTLGFVIGTFIPSCICILSSLACLYYITNRPSIRKHSHSRAELRSLSLIFVEIVLSLMSALQSYIINFFTCHRILFRLETDNCYGQSSVNILPNFLGSIVELFTSTSNILILMICGAQFRNELIEILHLRKLFPKKQQPQQTQQTGGAHRSNHKHSKKTQPRRVTLSTPSSQNGGSKTLNFPTDRSVDSFTVSLPQRDDFSVTEIEQASDETSQCLIKSTTV